MELSFIGGVSPHRKDLPQTEFIAESVKIRRKRISHLFTVKRTVTRRLFIRKILCAEHR